MKVEVLPVKGIVFFLALSSIVAGCGNDQVKLKQLPQNASHIQIEKGGYEEVRQSVFTPSCISCHNTGSATAGVNLDNYASIQSLLGAIQKEAISNRTMPPPPKSLSDSQIKLLSNWIAKGAPNHPGDNPISSSTTTPTPSVSPAPNNTQVLEAIRSNYDLYVKPLVQNACMDCHDAHAVPEGLAGHLPIVRGVELKHIREASAVLDFSLTFPNWSSNSSDPIYYLSQLKGVLEKRTMPPADFKIGHEFDGKLLKSFENQVILNWIADSEQKLASIVQTPPNSNQYFMSNCFGCHNSNVASGGFQFQKSGDQLVIPSGKSSKGIPYLTPGTPEKSAIYLVLLSDASKRSGLPEMPEGDTASTGDQQLIYNWIKAGAH